MLDTVAGTLQSAPNMNYARLSHQAVLLPTGEVLVVGGAEGGKFINTAEVFVPPR